MEKKTGKVASELCGAVIGAGFASGREVASFFARFGMWSWPGIAAAGLLTAWLALGVMHHPGETGMPLHWRGRWLAHFWRGMFTALLMATGGAMLAAGGEVAALLLPFHGARAVGMAVMLGSAWYMTRQEVPLLANLSRGLILCLLMVMVLGLFLPMEDSVSLQRARGVEGVAFGLCYGGFNTALAAPVIAAAGSELKEKERRRCVLLFTLVLVVLLCCGNAVLLRHASLREKQLPFIMLLRPLGYGGYVLGGISMGLAALTTLAACLRGLRVIMKEHVALAVAGVLLLSAGGLEGIVGAVYPALGAGCFLMMTAAHIQNQTKT